MENRSATMFFRAINYLNVLVIEPILDQSSGLIAMALDKSDANRDVGPGAANRARIHSMAIRMLSWINLPGRKADWHGSITVWRVIFNRLANNFENIRRY